MKLFNIYYINFPKVYEIKMMISNVFKLSKEIENNEDKTKEAELRGALGGKFLNFFNGNLEGTGKFSGSNSQKVLETFEIKTTKSIILNEIIENCKKVSAFEELEEGELVKIDDVRLNLENEEELRTVKLINSGSFKGLKLPEANGVDMNNLFNSMFKDYAYKIRGTIKESEENLLIKIPLTFDNELESSYSVDDLFIGKVSLVGLYKGKIKSDKLRNSFQFFQELGGIQNNTEQESDISHSQYEDTSSNNALFFTNTIDPNKEYYYIDLLAIVQNVNIQNKNI